MAVSVSTHAQSLSVQNIEAQTGEETQLVVSLSEGTSMTALQFNLSLPKGVSLKNNSGTYGTTLGEATDGHTLSIEPLASGDLLFILYSMDLKSFGNGEILRLPITAGSEAGEFSGSLTTFRTATVDAMSHAGNGATFQITVKDSATGVDAIDNSQLKIDNWYSVDGVKLQGEPTRKGVYIVNGKKVVK